MTGGGTERVRGASDTTGATKSAAKYRPYLAPALVSTTGAPRRVGRRIARRVAAASRWGLSAAWCGTGAVTGGD